nr:src kinase-associated phosphoprotein 2-like [Leptinotarsa decemlineata]
MGTDYKKMYLELNGLLEDICEFLSSEKLDNLSVKDKRLAESLINRSKKQLQEIAKVQINDEYVPMDKMETKKETKEEDGECEGDIYSFVDDCMPKIDVPIIEEVVPLSYLDFPAKDAPQGLKYGYISMRRKFLLGFEVMKRIYATIRKEWLLIYWGERDLKPMCTFNLHNFQAKESEGDKNYFELFGTDKKIYHFMALTHKDMKQWVVSINKCHDDLVRKKKSMPIIQSENPYSNDVVPHSNKDDIYEEGDEIYSELKPDVPGSIPKTMTVFPNVFVVKPPLPLGRPGTNKPKLPKRVSPPVVKPLTPTNHSSDEDLGSYEEIFTNTGNNNVLPPPKPLSDEEDDSYHVMSGGRKASRSLSNSTKSLDSFSAGSGDSIYQVFSDLKPQIRQLNGEVGKSSGETLVPPPSQPPASRKEDPPTKNKVLSLSDKFSLKPKPSELPASRKEDLPTKDEVSSPTAKPNLKQKPSLKKIPPPPPKRLFRNN